MNRISQSSGGYSPRILVTGGSGFIGRHVCAALADMGLASIVHARCDLTDSASISRLCERERPTHILHLAWLTRGDYAQNSDNVRWLDAGICCINEFYRNGGLRFVGVGTCLEYSDVQEKRDERTTPTLPDTLYGKCKLALCRYLAAIADAQGKSWAWCRPFYVTGPGEEHERLLPAAIRTLLGGDDFRTNACGRVIDYMDVRDVAAALVHVLLSDFCGIVNIASGEGQRVTDLLGFVASTIGRGNIVAAPGGVSHCSILAHTELLCGTGFKTRYPLYTTVRDMITEFDIHESH